jgi:hypothetical protein
MAEAATITDRLQKAGISQNAAEWVIKALSAAAPNGIGALIPDSSAVPVANPEYVYSTTVSAYGAGAWDMLVLTPPTYPLLAVIVTAAAGFDFANTAWAPGNTTVTTVLAEGYTSAQLHTQDVYTYTVIAPPVIGTNTVVTLEPSTQPIKWRKSYSSLTSYLVASDTTNQGTVTSGQYPARINPYLSTTVAAQPGKNFYSFECLEVPLNEANMTASNPKVRVAPAKMGVYQPLYNAGPTFEWAVPRPFPNVSPDYNWTTTGIMYVTPPLPVINRRMYTAVPSILAPIDPTAGTLQDGFSILSGTSGSAQAGSYSYGVDNTMTGVSIWRGLSNSASVTHKMVVGLEIQVSPTSPVRQFVVPAAEYEPKALQVYFDLCHDMPHSYPSSANFLGAVLAAAKTLLPMVLPAVSGIISHFTGPPPPPPPMPVVVREVQPEMSTSSTNVLARDVRTRPRLRSVSQSSRRSVKINTPRRKQKKNGNRRR